MFGQFTGEEEPDGGLDLPGGDGGPLVVVGQFGSFSSDTLKEIVDEGVHDAHGLGGDTSVGVDLFQHLVDVDGVGSLRFPLRFSFRLWRQPWRPFRISWQLFLRFWEAC